MRPAALPMIGLGCLLLMAGCQSHPLPDRCYQKPSSGSCRASLTRYYFDQGSHECKPFIWGGCGGKVPFNSLDECMHTCKAPASDNASSAKRPATPTGPKGGY